MRPGCVEGGVTNSSRGMIRRAANDEFPSLTPRSSLLLPFPFRYLLLFFSFLIFVSSFLSLSLSLPPPRPPLFLFYRRNVLFATRRGRPWPRRIYFISTKFHELSGISRAKKYHSGSRKFRRDNKGRWKTLCVCVCVCE